nr:chorismate synthase [Saprospiraceae bacterium]
MAGNIFGKVLTLKTFGESHGKAIGGILDGLPPDIPFSESELQAEMNRRRPGQSNLTTTRKEKDEVEILSGIQNGKTSGMPLGLLIRNTDARPSDYQPLKKALRPSHADFTY